MNEDIEVYVVNLKITSENFTLANSNKSRISVRSVVSSRKMKTVQTTLI